MGVRSCRCSSWNNRSVRRNAGNLRLILTRTAG
jgi:hypothetical protein